MDGSPRAVHLDPQCYTAGLAVDERTRGSDHPGHEADILWPNFVESSAEKCMDCDGRWKLALGPVVHCTLDAVRDVDCTLQHSRTHADPSAEMEQALRTVVLDPPVLTLTKPGRRSELYSGPLKDASHMVRFEARKYTLKY